MVHASGLLVTREHGGWTAVREPQVEARLTTCWLTPDSENLSSALRVGGEEVAPQRCSELRSNEDFTSSFDFSWNSTCLGELQEAQN